MFPTQVGVILTEEQVRAWFNGVPHAGGGIIVSIIGKRLIINS